MPHVNKYHFTEYRKYMSLKKCKDYAINKAYYKFFYLPIEKQDLELVAWIAFLDVEEQYDETKGSKSYESFFIDNVYWSCRDYCLKFINNKHKVLNHATSIDFATEAKHKQNKFDSDIERELLLKSTIEEYHQMNIKNSKGKIFKMLTDQHEISEIAEALEYSKTKVYRLMKEIEGELRLLLN